MKKIFKYIWLILLCLTLSSCGLKTEISKQEACEILNSKIKTDSIDLFNKNAKFSKTEIHTYDKMTDTTTIRYNPKYIMQILTEHDGKTVSEELYNIHYNKDVIEYAHYTFVRYANDLTTKLYTMDELTDDEVTELKSENGVFYNILIDFYDPLKSLGLDSITDDDIMESYKNVARSVSIKYQINNDEYDLNASELEFAKDIYGNVTGGIYLPKTLTIDTESNGDYTYVWDVSVDISNPFNQTKFPTAEQIIEK